MTPPDAETAAALLRSLGWSVVAPVDPPILGTRELDALAEAARWRDRAYWWRQASMRKLAAHGLVERHPDDPGTDARPAWRITEAGMARYSGIAP